MSWTRRWWTALARVRSDERRNVVASLLILFGVVSAHVMAETARDALFLASLPAEHLPWVYIAVAVIASTLGLTLVRTTRLSLSLTLGAASAITAALGALVDAERAWTLYALYVWSGVFGTVVTVQFWLVLARIFTVADAKRIYSLIGVGSVVGATVGAGATVALTLVVPAEGLLTIAAVMLALTSFGPLALRLPPGGPARTHALRVSPRLCARAIASHPYIQRLLVFVMVGAITLTMADYIFKAEAKIAIPPADMPTFFASFYAVVNAIALLAQLFLTGWLLRQMGVLRALWILPALMVGGAGLFIAGGGLLAAILLEGADGSLKHSLNRTVTEVLYIPIPERLRRHAKTFIDVMGQRGAQALGSVAILAVVGLGGGTGWVALLVVVAALGWLVVARALREPYLDLFRASLRDGAIDTRSAFPDLDLGSVEALVRALNSADDDEVLAAMELLAFEGKASLIPSLILHHPDERIVVRALELFTAAGRLDFIRVAERLLTHPDPRVRAAVVRSRSAVSPSTEVLESAAEDPDPLVRATALVGLTAMGAVPHSDTEGSLMALVEAGPLEARLAVAAAVTGQADARFCGTLLALAGCPEPEVKRAAAAAIAACGAQRGVDALIAMLEVRAVRLAARDALVQLGDVARERLVVAQDDLSLDRRIRLHIPRTLSRFPPEQVAPELLARYLLELDSAIRHKLLRGLGRIRARAPHLRFDDALVGRALEHALRRAFELVVWRRALERGAQTSPERRTEGHELLLGLLTDESSVTLEHIFRLLDLRHPDDSLDRIHRAIIGGDRAAQAGGLELIEHLVEPPLRAGVLALSADLTLDERLAAAPPALTPAPPAHYEALLAALLDSEQEDLRALAAYHVGELQLTSLRPQLEVLEVREEGYAREVLARALALFDPDPRPREAAVAR